MRKTIQLELWGRKEGRSQRERHFMRREKVLGQYPTPPAVAEWMVKWPEVLGIPKGAGLDPACGDGVFLKALAEAGFKRVVGFDIDLGALVRAKRSGDFKGALLVCGDALRLGFKIRGKFDFVAGNPPFSAKYGRIRERAVLNEFEVSEGRSSEAVELLFLELFVEATKEGGAFAIILPEGFFSSIPMERARRWLLSKVRPVAVVSLSRRFFRAKTSVLIAQKTRATGKVMLAHAEEERDLDKILGAFAGREDFSQAIWALHSELAETMSPLHFLMQRKAGPSEISPFPLVPLKELLAEIRTGATEYGAKRRFSPRGLPFVSAKTVTPFGVDISRDGRFVRPGGAMDKPRARVKKGDVLFVRVGVGCAGRVAVVLCEDEQGVADDYIYILRLKGRILPEYFAMFAQTEFFKSQIERLKRGVGTVTIPQRALKEVLVPLVPLDIQHRFAEIYRKIHFRFREGANVREMLRKAVEELEEILSKGGQESGPEGT